MRPAPSSCRIRGIARGTCALLILGFACHVRAQEAVPAGPTIGTWAFAYPGENRSLQPMLDLRPLNEKEAGQSGFVRLSPDGNDFVLGDGTPARFWAIGTDFYKQTPAEMA